MVQKVNVSLRDQSFYINRIQGDHPSMTNHHIHQDYEIFYLLEGERIYQINGKEYLIKKHHLVFIDKNLIHKTTVNSRDKDVYDRIVINFRDSFLEASAVHLLKQLFENGPHILQIPPCKRERIRSNLVTQLEEYQLSQGDKDLYLKSLLTQLLIESARLLEPKKTPSNSGNPPIGTITDIEAMIAFINGEYSNDVSLRVLSQQFHLNEQYISKLFKKYTGCSFIDYLNAIRINEAKRLLNESALKVNLIAKKVGYSNNVHFWRVFKKMTGMSPNEYRNHHQEQKNSNR
ncbi:helix-turn-helix domain-containing protein [Mesobacillus foraminis]|uniref:AraC family transcriptional regulator n=1 Tax=Mesobacillus foraminis TaxID=279826 RepID=UPI0039A2C406